MKIAITPKQEKFLWMLLKGFLARDDGTPEHQRAAKAIIKKLDKARRPGHDDGR